MSHDESIAPTRRAVLVGAGAAAAALLGGCANYDQNAPATPAGQGGGSDPNADPNADPNGEDGSSSKVLAQTSDIPVGGGAVIEDRRVVITQPTKGQFKCFTAVCTHQGCIVAEVASDTINCPCHGSKFNATDGSVAQGPASRPLHSVDITVDGGAIQLA